MGYAKVPDHRRPLRPSSAGQHLSLSRTPLIFNLILCLVLLLLPFLAGAEPLIDISTILEGPSNLDIFSINTTWHAGGYADILLHVPLSSGSDVFPVEAAEYLLPDGVYIALVPHRSRTYITITEDLGLTLVSRERVGGVGVLRYEWPVPICIRPGRHELQLRARASIAHQPPAVPIFVSVSDDPLHLSCHTRPQTRLDEFRRHYQGRDQNYQPHQHSLGADAVDEKLATPAGNTSDKLSVRISSGPQDLHRRGEDFGEGHYDKDYDDPGDAHPHTSTGTPYTSGSSSTYSAPYASSGNYSATATSPTPSTTPTSSSNGTSSVSGNSTSTIVVTSTATATSVQTVTSVSTDIETMVTTVTGSDSTEIYTTTQTLISTMMVVVSTTATGGFLPVNGATSAAMLPLTVGVTVCVTTMLWLLHLPDCGLVLW